MSGRITYAEAAEILRCHPSNIAKLIRRGQLKSRGRVRAGALSREEVEALAERRRVREEFVPKRRPAKAQLDPGHEWLQPRQVAELLGVSVQAVTRRIRRGRLPAQRLGGRWWVRRDLLEQVEAARLVQRTRRP